MSLFPEEQLDSPVGYFPAQPNQNLQKGKWTITRKLGWGPRSSTWLAHNKDQYGAIKILTAAASQDSTGSNERDILRSLQDEADFPEILSHFYEHDPKGERHLCLVFRVLGSSVEDLRLSNTSNGKYLPLYTVQKIVGDISQALTVVAGKRIIHGAVTADNFLFWSVQTSDAIRKVLARAPSKKVEMIQGSDGVTYPSVESQPIPHGYTWDSTVTDIMYTQLYLSNYAHASGNGHVTLTTPKILHPPEAIKGGKFSVKSDIWMLGCTTYLLLTGRQLFSDSYIASPVKMATETLQVGKLESLLIESGKISEEDISDTASFLRSCLAIKPANRASALDILDGGWIKNGCACKWDPEADPSEHITVAYKDKYGNIIGAPRHNNPRILDPTHHVYTPKDDQFSDLLASLRR